MMLGRACIHTHILTIATELVLSCVYIRVETESGHPGHPGQPDHILSGSSGSDLLYKISGSDPVLHCITCVDDGVWPL